MSYKYHKDGTVPDGDEIFVFGSNLTGRHGAGAAKVAIQKFGARLGWGIGPFGQSYAIPTKDELLKTLPLDDIAWYIKEFLMYAEEESELDRRFFVTRIGCGLAGFRDAEIAPLFRGAPENCNFPEQWRMFLG